MNEYVNIFGKMIDKLTEGKMKRQGLWTNKKAVLGALLNGAVIEYLKFGENEHLGIRGLGAIRNITLKKLLEDGVLVENKFMGTYELNK